MFGWLIKVIKKRKLMPKISATERAALDAGTVWVEADFFRGKPDFARVLSEIYPKLSIEEQAFVDGPVEQVCRMVDDWKIQQTRELPEEVWEFLREHRFFGLMIPKEFGGHAFGALACSAVFGKLATTSYMLNSVVLIPNSVGPAELITHYGTPEQKKRYLAPLASGVEMPCFALTEPNAGSDAASLSSAGVLFKDEDGRLKIRLSWDKRYITLAPIATLLGLAFRLHDPEDLLGKGEDLGITCALVPTDLPGVDVGRHHDPMGVTFYNGPTTGKDVVIDADQIIGGVEYAGKGWAMLMEALSGGRAISLPAGAAAGAKGVARIAGAYAALRKQFGLSIGRFEGVQEALGRIAGKAYLMEAARVYTCGAVDSGQKPSVVSAIAKYHQTELARQVINDGMDVLGGKAICRGPTNPIINGYIGAPIGITVEGANILTRTLIIFGQGAIRCHPFLQAEVAAIEAEDPTALRKALVGHGLYVMGNAFRSAFHGVTRGWFSFPEVVGPGAKYARKLCWASARYAVLADLTVAALGPKLKQRGRLAGRFADALSWMYLAAATLRRFEAEGRQKEDEPLFQWAMETCLAEIQRAFEGIYRNFEFPLLSWYFRSFGAFWTRVNSLGSGPSDKVAAAAARALLSPGATRDRLTAGLTAGLPEDHPRMRMERAFRLCAEAEPLVGKMQAAMREGKLERGRVARRIEAALEAEVLTADEAARMRAAEAARAEVLAVDDFSHEQYLAGTRDLEWSTSSAV